MDSIKRFTRFLAVLLCLLFAGHIHAQVAMTPGVTAWVYRTGQFMTQLPVLVGTPPTPPNPYYNFSPPTPNHYTNYSNIDFTSQWVPAYEGDELNYCYGHIWGNLLVSTPGTYQFRVTSEDGSKFFINTALVVDNDRAGLNSSVGTLNLLAGSYPFYLNFYQNPGSHRVLLEWMPPGASQFVAVPASAFQTEDGQTFVTSPGIKGWNYPNGSGGTAGGPGDGAPLASVHPSFTLENFRPAGFNPRIGGIAFLPDGRMVVSTWDSVGGVYILDNLQGPGPVTYKLFARGLGEPLGVAVVDGEIYIAQKREVTRLRDTDGDGCADEYEAVAHGWPASYNYHEFTFNLVAKDGYFWTTTSTPLKSGDTTYLDGTEPGYPVPNGPGSLIRIDPVTRSWEIVSTGLRTPNGMGIGVDGELFCSDNQGDWLPACKINHMLPGKYYGVPQSSTQSADPIHPPALWMPYNRISNSTSEPVLVTAGTYAGQMLVGELTDGGIARVFMEKINGVYQGACFAFSQGFEVGLNRLAWGPDGCLYMGGLGSGGNWNWNGTSQGLQRIRPNGNVTFEMMSVKNRSNGFQIEMTQPVQAHLLSNPANYTVQQYQEIPAIGYGAGDQSNLTTLTVSAAQISADRKKVFIQVNGLAANRVAYIRLKNFRSDSNAAPWATEAWYTINNLSTVAGPDFTPATPPPAPPVPPTLTSPGTAASPGTEIATLTPTFNWSAVTGATGYGLYLTDLTTGTMVYPNSTGITTTPLTGASFALPSGVLMWGHSYRWAMTSFENTTENPTLSSYFYFRTQSVTFAPGPADRTVVYQAEDAAFTGPRTAPASELAERPGWTGTNYLDYQGASNEFIEWTVTAHHAGRHTLAFFYALGVTTARPLAIAVNGSTVNPSLSFPGTGTWATWQSVSTNVNLQKGVNLIRATSIGSSGPNMDRLDVTGPGPVPASATVLFDGTNAAGWLRDADGTPANWLTTNGWLQVGHSPAPNDIASVQKFKDCTLHIEWLAPAGGTGLNAGNSGIKLQRSYEIQVLNTAAGASLTATDAGSIYSFLAAGSNRSTGPNTWQSFDITYMAPRWSGGTKITNARITAYWNGVLVHDNVEVSDPTDVLHPEASGLQSILLEDHPNDATGEVLFRNIWVIPYSTPFESWTSWLAAHNLTGEDADPQASPAHDGISNLWKYAAGADPHSTNPSGDGHPWLPQMSIVTQGSDAFIEFTYRRRTDWQARGMRFTAEASSSLEPGSWVPCAYTEIGAPVPSGDGITEIVTVRFDEPIPPGTSQQFSRVRVELLE